ncbi:MAG TPA: 3-methyl-2-oxobutanoate dehydrogenase subunit beta [Cyanobacteria bacterium UBA11991]|nr:3-methyl-2-oxobutanoate dehydrogenase subunit VorB [Cyanobacteriota bacterium]MDY6357964.1 3-methyl-2-oxobutanoate dehydrogenase subunit VorB [Cyanobacteriota bacterium]MDY6364247.1 3-methyl-2-oxobutanoate dehydrogenase subunit VorB [Cyanobacteriota bacterium]MDY6383453.1 3-methyl-2-oxobutanoate dehydrogenase subunit VorB [Cyanobacteriota bacterium]HCB11843.1 3-methyl-2-oxobutanoate dehydrogenase subunit beta [Cyanobacteria bacterium UBA11991]
MTATITDKKILMKGNYAIANAAVLAGCQCYFGYPITPQSEIGEFMSGKMQELHRAYVSAESELAAINMTIGACSTGVKAMTSSSSCAVALMQEGLSYATSDQLPIVLVSVMRGGPGLGNIYPSQGDYFQATRGGGNGDYHLIVLAPSTVQECADLTYKAFYLAQKYRNPTVLLADGLLGQMMEPVKFKPYPYPEIDNSDWALDGAKGRDGRIIRSYAPLADDQCIFLEKLFNKYKQLEENETEWEEIGTEDADIILIAFGSTARNVKTAAKICRQKGLKVGVLRPITLFPFPSKRISELSKSAKKIYSVEVNMGQMIQDIKLAVNGQAPVELINRPVGNPPAPEEIVSRIEESI